MTYTSHGLMTPADWAEHRQDYGWDELAQPDVPATKPERWIDSERKCICCAVTVGYPEPDCEIHGMDACCGRFDSCWWGRIRLPHIARDEKS